MEKNPFDQFDNQANTFDQFDAATEKPAPPSGAIRRLVGDKALGFASGAIGATKAIADVAGAGNRASQVLSDIGKGVDSYLSPEAKADQQEQSGIMAESKGKGTWEGIKAGARAFGVAPVQTAVQGLGSVVPILAGTAFTGGALPAAAAGAGIGAAMGAGTAKGAIFDEIKKRSLDAGMGEAEATAAATKAQEYGGANTDQIALGGVLGTADALTGVAGAAGRMARGAMGKPVTQALVNTGEQGILRRMATGVASEIPLEAAQGGQEQIAANLAAQRAGYQAGTFDNVASNATLEALASAGPGAAFGALEGGAKRAEPTVEDTTGGLALAGDQPPEAAPVLDPATGGVIQKTYDPRDPNSRPPLAIMPKPEGIDYPEQVKPSARMGIDPAAWPISSAAALAVDSGAHQTELFKQAEQAAIENEAKKPDSKGTTARTQTKDSAKSAFKSYEEAQSYITEQKQRGTSVQALPLPQKDGSYSMAMKGTPDYTIAEFHKKQMDMKAAGVLDGDILTKSGDIFAKKAPAVSQPGQAPQAVGAQPAGPAAGVPAAGTPAVQADGAKPSREVADAAGIATSVLGEDMAAKNRFADFADAHAGKPAGEVQSLLAASEFGPKLAGNELAQISDQISKSGSGVASQARANAAPQVEASDSQKLANKIKFQKIRVEQAGAAVASAQDVDQFGLPIENGPKKQAAKARLQKAEADLAALESTQPPANNNARTTTSAPAAPAAGLPAAGTGAVEAAGLSDQLEDALFKERDATTSAIENDWMKGNGRRRLTNIERSIYDAVTASTLDADSAAQIIETALENDRPDLAQYAASRAMRAAESMDTTPGVPQSSPKYGKIKSDLEASKKQALDAASALQEIVNSKQAPQAADVKAITAKQIPAMTDVELQQAIEHYGPESIVQPATKTVAQPTEKTSDQAPKAKQSQTQPEAGKAAADIQPAAGPGVGDAGEGAAAKPTSLREAIERKQNEPTTHAGLKIYPIKIKVGDKIEQRWGVQTPRNAERERNGERQIGGDPLSDTLDGAKKLAEQEVATAKDQQERSAAHEAEAAAAQAKKDANKGKSILQRRADALLDKQHTYPPQAGLGQGTRREAMQKSVDQGRAIVERMVLDTAAKHRDQTAIDLVRARGYILGLSNENIPVVKQGLEAQARMKANQYEKPEYRVYDSAKTDGGFYEITKTEFDYAKSLEKADKAARQAAPNDMNEADANIQNGNATRELSSFMKNERDAATRSEKVAEWRKQYSGDHAETIAAGDISRSDYEKLADLVRRGGVTEQRAVEMIESSVSAGVLDRFVADNMKKKVAAQQGTPTHQDPGEKPEAATAPVIAQSLAKAARKEDHTQKEMRLWLVGEIDKAVKLTEDYSDYQESIKKNGQDIADSIFFGKHSSSVGLTTPQGNGTITFDVPGDGKFKIRNSLRGLMEFRAKVEAKSGTGFTDKTTKAKGLPASTGVAKGSSNQIEALSSMLEELDFEAAVDYARETGVSLNDAKVPPHIRDQLTAYLKDGTLPPAPFSPTRYWEYQASSRADKDGNPIREASLTKEIGADTYIANVTGTNATGFTFTVTKGAETFEKKSGTFRTFSDALQGAESKIASIQPEVVKPKDTGWNMRGTGYAGKRYKGRNITLDDGREVVARIYENAGQYEEAEVKVDGVSKFRKTDRYKAEKLADDFIRTLTAKEPAKAPIKVTPQVSGNAEKFIKVAADSVDELRQVDVERVLSETPVHFRAEVSAYIKSNRAGLSDEVDAVMADLNEPAQASQTEPKREFRNPDNLNVLHAPIEDKDWFKLKNGEEWQARQGYSGRGWSLVRNGNLHPEARNFESQSDFIRSVIEVTGQTQAAGQVAAPIETNDEPIPAVTESQARKQFEWRNMGQKDGTKSHLLFFFEREKDKGTGAAMGRGEVSLYPGSSGWQVDGGDGTHYKSLADAKAAAIDLAIPILQDQGYVLKPAQAATAILDAANVTGKERIDALKDVKKGDITPEELQAAYPAKEDGEKTEPWKMTRAEAAESFPGDEYDKMLNRHAVLGDITYEESNKRSRINITGNKEFWAKTRKELLQDKKDAVKFARGDRAEVNKMKPTEGFAAWRIKSMSATGKAAIEAAGKYHDELLAVHKERVQEALDEGKDVPAEVLADYPDLAKPDNSVKPEAKSEISDFGEVLPGARKDAAPSLKTELSDNDIATQPLSKIWPADEYLSIDDKFASALSFAARAEIPAKPRTSYKVKNWVEKVKTVRDLAQRITSGSVTRERMAAELAKTRSLSAFADKIALLEAIDREHWPRIDSVEVYPDAYRYNDDGTQTKTPLVRVSIDGRSRSFDGATSVADVVERVIAMVDTEQQQTKKMQFEVRGTESKGFGINKKGDKEYRKLKTFPTAKEAFEFIKAGYDDLVAEWEGIKDRDNVKKDDVRGTENRPRSAKDYRNGKDVTSEQFAETFGFRGGQFGKWVNQGEGRKDRQGMLNQAYDALMDLSDIVGIPPRAVSLNGTLGLAFGARGSGTASAHYEPDTLVINLTKTRGAGVLAHEWFHALDNYFSHQRGGAVPMSPGMTQLDYRKANYITYKPEPLYVHKTKQSTPITKATLERYAATSGTRGQPGGYYDPENWHLDPRHPEGVRPEVERRIAELVEALNASPMAQRAASNDKAPEGYWSRIIERAARSFENYVISKMMERGYHNDYLANVREVGDFPRSKERYPYLLPEEVKPIAEAFDNLFSTVQTKETDKGVAMFSRSFTPAARSQATDVVERQVARIKSKWKNAPKIIVAFDMADERIPAAVRAEDQRQRSGGAAGTPEGFYYGGTVYLMSSQLKSPGDVQRVLFHETLGHFGLRGTFGDGLKPILQQIATFRKAEVDAKIKEYGLRSVPDLDRLIAAEEVLAEMAQNTPEIGFVKRAIAVIRTWLRENGFSNLTLTDDEIITQLIIPARAFVEQGGKPKNLGGNSLMRSLKKGDWYSELSRQVMANKQQQMPAGMWASWIDSLKTKGVKPDEIEWSGVTDWLKMQPGKVTKQQVLAYLDANGVQVQEVTLGGDGFYRDANGERVFDDETGDYIGSKNPGTKYENYTLPGGQNYREVLLTLPERRPLTDAWRRAQEQYGNEDPRTLAAKKAARAEAGIDRPKPYTSSHWDQPNVIAHIRLNDRTDADGARVLFVEEIQSDWGQDGKKKGFTKDTTGWTAKSLAKPGQTFGNWNVFDANGERVTSIVGGSVTDGAGAIRKAAEGIPLAPFIDKTDKWLTLALKRIVKMAVDGGYDKVAFVNGKQSADRYALSSAVDTINWRKNGSGTDKIVSVETERGNAFDLFIDGEGLVGRVDAGSSGFDNLVGQSLDEIVGKDFAGKILSEDRGDVSGEGLDIGGDGMKTFYDAIVPNATKALLKKLGGGKMETVGLATDKTNSRVAENRIRKQTGEPLVDEALLDQPGFTITPAMQEKAAGGMPMFSRGTNEAMTNNDVVGNQGGRSADDTTPGGTHPFNGFTREQFLGNPKITSDANAKDLVPSTWKSLESEKNVPFAIGSGLTARYSELSAAVYNEKGDVVASYSSGDTLVVNKKYRRQGIGSELVYQWRMRNPNSKTAATRTKKSQLLQEKVWNRIRSERALYESRIHQDSNESTAPDSGGAPMFSRSKLNETLKNITVTDIKARTGNKLADYRGLGLQFLGGRQIVDLYGKDIPQLNGYTQMVQQMSADANEVGAQADKIATGWANLKDERQLAELMHDATLAQIDPAKPLVEGDNPLAYGKLNGLFKALSDDAKKVYREARDAYEEHYAQVRDAIRDKIERSEMSSASKAAMLERMDGEFFDKIKGVYFPLARFGKYVVVTRGPTGVVNVSRAETLNEAQATRELMRKAYPSEKGFMVGKVIKDKEFNASRDAVGRGFLKELFGVLDEKGMGEELQDAVNQLYLASMPDLSWAKHGIHRKGTPGFSQDARRAFAQNMFHGARYLAKLRYADQLADKLTQMEAFVESKSGDESFDQPKARDVLDELVKRHDSLMNPKSNPLSTALTSFGFVFHMGLSPASAIVNLSGTAMVAYPIMGAKWGFDKAATALMKAGKEAATHKNDISQALNADEKRAYDAAVKAGTIDVTAAHDLAGIAQGEDAGVMWKLRPVMKWASFLFHHAERFNRQITFVAAYRLARETGSNPEAAFEQATKATYDGHFDYAASNRPRVMQGPAIKVITLFKQYGQNMVYTLTRQAQQAMNAETPEQRRESRKALAGLLVMHAAGAGVLGLPLVGTLLAAASMIGGSDDEPWDAEVALRNMLADAFGQKPAEVLARGLSRLTPWDISGRVGLDKLILPDIQEGLEGQRLGESVMAAALGPVAGIGINVTRGMQEISEGHLGRGIETMMPAAFRAPLKALRYEMEGAKDKTGVMIKDEVGLAGVAGQALGFSPSEVRNATEGRSAIYAADKRLMARRSELMAQYAQALIGKDTEGVAEAMAEIRTFNEKNPNRRINGMQLAISVKNRNRRVNEAADGVYLPKKRRDMVEEGRFAVPQ